MFHHQDTLQRLNENIPSGEKLTSVHYAIKERFNFINRIAVAILQKKGKLTEAKTKIMRTILTRSVKIIDSMLKDHGLDSFENINILYNIAGFHHEAVNGTGYPNGLQDTEIPLEARIVAAADVFDALTSKRPYKEAWKQP